MKFRFKTRTISEEFSHEEGSDHELTDKEMSEASTDSKINDNLILNSVNDAYLTIEGNGSFQKWCALLIGLTISLNVGYVIPFLTLIPNLNWTIDDGATWSTWNKEMICDKYKNVPSNQFSYKMSTGNRLDNWISDFHLMWSSNVTLGLFGSLHFIGYVLGSIFIIRLGDVYGRKPILLMWTIATIILTFLMYFTEELWLIYLLLIISGMFIISKGALGYVYMLELIPESKCGNFHSIWSLINSSFGIFWIVLFYFLKDLRIFFLIISALCIIHLMIIIKAPESPKFLYSKKRWSDLHDALYEISKFNNSTEWKHKFKAEINNFDEPSTNTISIVDALRDTVYRKNLFIMVINWIVWSSCFHLINFYVGKFPGSIYLNGIIIVLADIISSGISYPYVSKVGFNYGYTLSYAIVIIMSIIYTFSPQILIVNYACVFLIKFWLSLCFSLSYFGSSEYFDVNVKSRSFAICNFFAKWFTVTAPMLVETLAHPIILIATLVLLAGITSQFLEKPKHTQDELKSFK